MPVTQTYAEHVQRAKDNGWCYKPGNCPGGVYYYGGIDWGIASGTPIYAAAPGRVETQTQVSGYGVNTRITHNNGWYTIYGHMQRFTFITGESVKAGDLIGYSDNTGNSTGPHLHFELRHNGVPEDPMPYLELLNGTAPTPAPIPDPSPAPAPGQLINPLDGIQLPSQIMVSVLFDDLIMRDQPSRAGHVLGVLSEEELLPVLDTVQAGGYVWAKIGRHQYVAIGGPKAFVKLVE